MPIGYTLYFLRDCHVALRLLAMTVGRNGIATVILKYNGIPRSTRDDSEGRSQ